MIDHIEGSLKIEEDYMCDLTGLQKGVEDSSIDISRVMAAKACLGKLYLRPATSIEVVEEQTFEGFIEHSDQYNRPNIVRVL